jgi:hypothetical protein
MDTLSRIARAILLVGGILFLYGSSAAYVRHSLWAAHRLQWHREEVRIAARFAENYRLRGDVGDALRYVQIALAAAEKIDDEKTRARLCTRLRKSEMRLKEAAGGAASQSSDFTSHRAGRGGTELLKDSVRRFRLGYTDLDDVALNVSVFFCFGFLFVLAGGAHFSRAPLPALLATFFGALLLSTAIEMGQLLSPPRTPDVGDIFYDSAGALLGALAAFGSRFSFASFLDLKRKIRSLQNSML